MILETVWTAVIVNFLKSIFLKSLQKMQSQVLTYVVWHISIDFLSLFCEQTEQWPAMNPQEMSRWVCFHGKSHDYFISSHQTHTYLCVL